MVLVQTEKSIPKSPVIQPFTHSINLTWRDKLQILVMSFTLVPLRLISISFCIVSAWALAKIAMIGFTKEKSQAPMQGLRNILHPFIVLMSRGIFFCGGFHWVSTKGKCATPQEATVLVQVPHSSYIDTLAVPFFSMSSIVSKSTIVNIPFFGTITQYTQPVFVSREDPDSRQNTVKEIQKRAKSGKWPQIIIFPEGTCTNRSCLISFKTGAFIPGVPVQPVCVRYLNAKDTYTWTWEGPGAFELLWYTLCQFNNKLELEFLPVYYPNEEEKNDPRLFADNVRDVMAKALNVPVTDHSYEDIQFMNYAEELGMPVASALADCAKLSKRLGFKLENLKEQMRKFCLIAQNNHHDITLEEFAAYLELPSSSEYLKKLFNLYDKDESGTIDFREYLLALSLISKPANTEETIELAFKIFDRDNKGFVLEGEFTSILKNTFGEDINSEAIFREVDSDCNGHISFNEFYKYAQLRPEYAKIFTQINKEGNDETISCPNLDVDESKLCSRTSNENLSERHEDIDNLELSKSISSKKDK